jgi:hypothetical protein
MGAPKNGKPPGWIYETSLESLPADVREIFREACTGVGIVDEDVIHALLLAQTKILDGAYKGLRKDVLGTIEGQIAPLSARIEALKAELSRQNDQAREEDQTARQALADKWDQQAADTREKMDDLARREAALAARESRGWQSKLIDHGMTAAAAIVVCIGGMAWWHDWAEKQEQAVRDLQAELQNKTTEARLADNLNYVGAKLGFAAGNFDANDYARTLTVFLEPGKQPGNWKLTKAAIDQEGKGELTLVDPAASPPPGTSSHHW